MRISVALALIPILAGFSADELALLAAGIEINPAPAPFDKFSDRVPETKAVCDFLPKVAAVVLPAIT